MPKEYINWPEPEHIVRAVTQEELDAGNEGLETLPPGPRIGIHWHANETVQLSLDMDWDVLQEIVKTRQDDPNAFDFDADGTYANRQSFFTEALSRSDLQRLIKHARRARDAAYGADE